MLKNQDHDIIIIFLMMRRRLLKQVRSRPSIITNDKNSIIQNHYTIFIILNHRTTPKSTPPHFNPF